MVRKQTNARETERNMYTHSRAIELKKRAKQQTHTQTSIRKECTKLPVKKKCEVLSKHTLEREKNRENNEKYYMLEFK